VSRKERLGRDLIYLQTLGVAVGYALAVYLMDRLYVRRHIEDGGLAFGYAFCLTEGGVIAVLLLLSMVIKFVRRRRDIRWARVQPQIVEKASAHLGGADCTRELRALRRRYPKEVEQSMSELLLRVRGTAAARLTALIVDLGLVERWKRASRSRLASTRRDAITRLGLLAGEAARNTLVHALGDSDDEVRLEASRALISAGGVTELTAVLRTAVNDSLLVRAILTEALRPHAALLCEKAVPELLAGNDPRSVRVALEILRAWRKSMPIAGVQPLLHHPDGAVRTAALGILPQLVAPRDLEPELLECLSDEVESVRAAAADAAGELRLVSALPALEACLNGGGAEAAISAAYAMARIGAQGWRILEGLVLNSRSAAASAALEALEQARSERLLPGTV
jgi:HEAT repeat protein